MNNQKFIDRLPKQVEETNEVKLRFLKDVQSGKQMSRAYGILGEKSGSDAFVDEVIKPKEGGTYLKLYGISYLFKGSVEKSKVHSIELVKYLYFQVPQERLVQIVLLAHLPLFLIARQMFYKKVYEILWAIDHRTVAKVESIGSEECITVREMKGAVSQALHDTFGIDLSKPYYPVDHTHYHKHRRIPYPVDVDKNALGWILVLIARFMFVFLELDTAYRFRFQDAFGEMKERTIQEFFRIMELLISRESASGVGYKWKFMRLAAKLGFFLVPQLQEFIVNVLKNIKVENIRLDEHDTYFVLGYSSYNFFGKSKEWRFAERMRLDKERGHTFFFGDNMLE